MGVRPSASPKDRVGRGGERAGSPAGAIRNSVWGRLPTHPLAPNPVFVAPKRLLVHRNAFWRSETRFGAPKRVLALRNVFWRSDPSAERGWVALRLSASLTPIRWPGNRSGDPYCLPFSFLSWTSTGVPSFGICFRRSGVIVIRGCTCWRPPTRTQSSRSRPCRMTRRPSS